jgi:uncharacterized protein (TIGR02145 family)/uncharacterized repeat protein (TIGR02543 family)
LGSQAYTATITLTPTTGFTLTGVAANFFTVAGATTVTNPINSGVVTAVFPATVAAVINIAAIPGVTVPVTGAVPVTTITQTAQYTGTVSWSPANNPFAAATAYTATIVLTAKAGFTFTGVAANFFTVAGSTSAIYVVNSGVVTALFPTTAAVINIAAIPGVTVPVTGATPVTTITATAQYTGTVTWSGSPVTFAPVTIYTATITLTPKAGFTLTGVAANFFAVIGATSVITPVNSGIVTAVFPATTGYIITFNGQSATVPPNPASKEVVSPATTVGTLPTPPTKTGSCFDGWYTDINGGGTEFLPYTVVTASITVYAKWAAPVPDIDGNVYTTIRIGTQTWMVENLKTTKFNDNTVIPAGAPFTAAEWAALTTPGYCWYNNDIANKAAYGALYNWYTVNTGKLAPAGWHVPTDVELTTLENYLIANGYNWDNTTTGNKIAKSMAAKTIWNTSTSAGAIGNDLTTNNRSGFSALPGGCRSFDGTFGGQSYGGGWWSAAASDATYAWDRGLFSDVTSLDRGGDDKGCGFSVRLVRN